MQTSENKTKPVESLSAEKKIEKIEENLSKLSYEDLVKKHPAEAVEIAIEKLSSNDMGGVGLEISKLIIKEKSWDYFIDQSLKIDVNKAGIGNFDYVLLAVRECMHKLGNPVDLPVEKIEDLLRHTKNDIEWMNIKSLADLRRRVEDLQSFSAYELGSLAYDCNVDYFKADAARKEAAEIIHSNPEEYYGLMQDLYQGLREMCTDCNSGTDSEIIIETMKRWENMTVEELLSDIYPVFSFNIATRYKTHEEISRDLILDENDLRDKLKKLIKKNTEVFYHAMYRQEYKDKSENLIDDRFNEYNIVPALGEFAEKEGQTGDNQKFGYAVNSTLTPIAKDTLILHSPTGRLLAILDSGEKMEKKFVNSKEIMLIANFLSHENQLGEKHYNQTDTSLAACLVFWDIIPEQIRKGVEDSFERHGLTNEEVNSLLAHARKMNFEGIIDIASEYSPMFSFQLANRMHEFVSAELKERVEDKSPHFIGPGEYLESVNSEHGKTSISKGEIRHDMSVLNFSTIKYLENNLALDLSLLSWKEFFSLIIYLKQQEKGKGFTKLKNFIGNLDSQPDKINRVKSFLSLETGHLSGEQILFIGESLGNQPDVANKLFAQYAEIVDDSIKTVDEACRLFADVFPNDRLESEKVQKAILRGAVSLLAEANEKLKMCEVENEEEKNTIILSLIEDLKKEKNAQVEILGELRKIVAQLDDAYNLWKKKKSEMELSENLLKEKYKQIVFGDSHAETDNLLILKYKEIKESIASASKTISACFGDAERHLKPEEIANELFKEAIDIISTPTSTDEDRGAALEKLNGINANVLLTGKIVGQLPREEVAKLDLKKISHIEKLKDVSGSELLSQPNILRQIKQIIKFQFPDGDDEAFEEECRTNPNFRLTISLANKKIISFFSKEQRSDNIDYVDWFIANPDAPIKGLGEATLRLGFDGEEESSKSYYAVAKPHVKSFQILVENLGFVSFNGSTEDGEYKHHYTRIRKLTDDKSLKTKKMSASELMSLKNTIGTICLSENVIESFLYKGKALNICKVIYHGQTHHDDIKKTDPDGWLMAEIDRQNKKGYVLSRFISENTEKDNQIFYAVFEKDASTPSLREELDEVVSRSSSSHSDSKKALSN